MKVPTSTYRLQLNAEFRFSHVRDLIPYFRELGVGYLYLSPVFQARPRSPHGYDVTNPTQLNHEIGSDADFAALSGDLHAAGMGLLLDIVPNHMATDTVNPWWHDVLEHGPASLAATFFDIAWDAAGCDSRVILPVLGQDPAAAAVAGELRPAHDDGELQIAYFETSFPLDPATYATLLTSVTGADALVAASRAIGPRRAGDGEAKQRRRDAGLALKALLREWAADPQHEARLQQSLAAVDAGEVLALLELQAYRLEFWRTGAHRLNYRRFFNISDLAAVRVEDPAVFATTHTLIFDLMHSRRIDGLRVDHVDGLRDPAAYLNRLRAGVGDEYIVVEKVLAPTEDLPESWPVEGTTGYDFVGLLAGLFCEAHGLAQIRDDYGRRTGSPPYAEVVYDKKKLVIAELFRAELQSLTNSLEIIARLASVEADRELLAACITEVTAAMNVYRTYINGEVSSYDRTVIKYALTTARHRAPHIPDAVYVLMRALLLNEELPEEVGGRRREFIADWQQFSGPIMAKGMEDTSFYTYNALIAQCEVGAQPDGLIASAGEFHEWIGKRAGRWPHTMNASSTHDTKRSEDVRARLHVLTEMPDAWQAALDRWLALTEKHVRLVDGTRVPAANEAILIFQTLIGVWPLVDVESAGLSDRLRAFSRKAAREAKTYASWREPNDAYEDALFAFIQALLDDAEFLADFSALHETVAWYGALNSLAQLTLKIGVPGVPDIYRGNEAWRFSLVDPDNRRPVEFAELSRQLRALPQEPGAGEIGALLTEWRDGRVKLHLTRAGLQLRRAHAALFTHGEFIPIAAVGRFADHVIAFARRHQNDWALIVTGRFFSQLGRRPLGATWSDTQLELPANAPTTWRNAFTNEITDGATLEAVFATLPFAILIGGVQAR